MKTLPKLGLLGALYLSQGLPFGFFTQALPVMLRERGLSYTSISLTTLLALPWAFKFLWAPAVDGFGTRRGWILSLQGLAALVLIAVSALEPDGALSLLLGAVLLTNLLAATQDIATDGLAVDLLSPEERGYGNGVQVAGYRVGMIIGGGLLLVLYDSVGWTLTFLMMAGILAAATIPIAAARGEPRLAPKDEEGGLVAGFFKREGMLRWLGILVVFKAGDYLAGGILRPWLVDRGFSMADLGWLLGGGGFTAGLLGALAGGWGVGRLGRKSSLVIFGLLQASAIVAFALIELLGLGRGAVVGACLYEHFVGGLATVALFTAMMDRCRPGRGGTDYTLQASLVVFATGAFGAISGASADMLGVGWHYGFAAVVALFGVACVAHGLPDDRAAAP